MSQLLGGEGVSRRIEVGEGECSAMAVVEGGLEVEGGSLKLCYFTRALRLYH